MSGLSAFFLSVAGSVSTVGLLGMVGYVSRTWIAERLRGSIQHEYDLKMLEVEYQKEVRIKSEIVAELLAHWIRKDGKLDYYELNRLAFQAFMWLPDELAKDLSNCLSHQQGAIDVRALVKRVRTCLQGCDDALQSRDVIVFNEPSIHREVNSSVASSEAAIKPLPHT